MLIRAWSDALNLLILSSQQPKDSSSQMTKNKILKFKNQWLANGKYSICLMINKSID